MGQHAQPGTPLSLKLQDVSAELVGQQIDSLHPYSSTQHVSQQDVWESLAATPNLQRYVIQTAADLAPDNLAERGIAVRAMLGVVGLLHQQHITDELEASLQITRS